MSELQWTQDFFSDDMGEKFWAFHQENPHVLKELAGRATSLTQRGHRRIGIGMLFEVMRWNHMLKTSTNEPFKLNNNYRAYYSRLIEHEYPGLRGVFTKRQSLSDTENMNATQDTQ